jgi:hypothetical protein
MPIRSTRDDYILSEIRKIAAMIARAMTLRASGDVPAARAEIDAAYSSLLGRESALLRMLDAVSAARLVGDSRKVVALARLTFAEAALAADVETQQPDRKLVERARVLAGEAAKMDPANEDATAAVKELRAE